MSVANAQNNKLWNKSKKIFLLLKTNFTGGGRIASARFKNMSTAIMQTGAMSWDLKFHDWNDSNDVGDIQLKDQYSYGSISHQQQPQSIGTNRAAQTMRNSVSAININANVLHTLPNGMSIGPDAQLIQSQIAVIQQQQQQHQQKLLHNALTRTVSHQPTTVDIPMLTSAVDAMPSNENHRKLERTQSEPAPQVNTSRYKTELCRPFKETGECKYGEKCQFAHGENELRTVQRHPKYKTEYCRTFYGIGLCPYGSRCHFLHDLSNDEDTTRARAVSGGSRNEISNGRPFNGNKDAIDSNRIAAAHNGGHGFTGGRNMISNEVDAITKAARFIGAMKDEPMPHANRTFGRSASVINTNAVGPASAAVAAAVHSLPMSPPLSMSTGSDRASPICSLSPTNSIANFPFTEPANTFNVNTLPNGIYTPSSLHITPPASPPAAMITATTTPPPTPILPNAVGKSAACMQNGEKSRLPIFNQISCASTIDALSNLPM